MAATKTDALRDELEQIKSQHGGLLRPIDIIAWAKAHPKSALHTRFEWDNTKAAHEYRLEQARRIIRVQVTTIASVDTRMFVSVKEQRKLPEGGYHSIEDALDDPDLYQQLLQEARLELNRLRRKYRRLEELQSVWEAIDNNQS